MGRMLELRREPEVVFWVFVFPLLLALGLGIAFRNKPGDATSVAIVAGARSQGLVALLRRSPPHASFKVDVRDGETARNGFRLGKYDLVIEPDGKGGIQYRYDPARPESVLARPGADPSLLYAAGRTCARPPMLVIGCEPGPLYSDYLL